MYVIYIYNPSMSEKPGVIPREEADLLYRNTNKEKRLADGDPTPFEATNPMTTGLSPVRDLSQGVSFRDSLIGEGFILQVSKEDEGLVSDDDEHVEGDNPDCSMIYLTKEEKTAMRRSWRKSLIIKIMGRTIVFNYLLNRLKNLWKPKAGMTMIALENDYFLVRFTTMLDYHHAMFAGPRLIMDHYLIVKEWSPNFDPWEDTEEKLLVWVWLPGIPIEYFNAEFLEKVGNKIGRLMRIDDATSEISRRRFARICVEVDITKPLLPRFKIKGRAMKIEYEGFHLICFHCGIYGHRNDGCPSYIVELNLEK